MFNVIRVDPHAAEATEPLGTKRKFWYRDSQRRMLFKAEDRGTGEDWAEKIACELCVLIGLPHVRYELALESDGNTPGVVCESFSPPPISLILGNQLLLQRDPAYPSERKYKVHEHTVKAVVDALGNLDPPSEEWWVGTPPEATTALDVFTGYILLDAWIANQDRHHENWAALRNEDRLRLAPTFDHGASLARNLTDEERMERLNTRDRNRTVAAFAARASSGFYAAVADAKPLGTFAAFAAFAAHAPAGARAWTARLQTVSMEAVRGLLDEVPPNRMTRIARDFTLQLLTLNRQRLIEEVFQ